MNFSPFFVSLEDSVQFSIVLVPLVGGCPPFPLRIGPMATFPFLGDMTLGALVLAFTVLFCTFIGDFMYNIKDVD